MNNFHEIKPEQIEKNPFNLIGNEWMLIAAEKDSKVNTMTIGLIKGMEIFFAICHRVAPSIAAAS